MRTRAIALVVLLAVPFGAAAENYLHHSLQATVLVADPAAAVAALQRWTDQAGGYVVLKSSERIVLRYPFDDTPELSRRIEELSDDLVELFRQAADLREEVLGLQAGIRSREEMLQRTLRLVDGADVAGTLAIEQEVLALIEELEALKGSLRKLNVDRAFGRADIAFQVLEQSLPKNLPSSFPWINSVDFYRFLREGGSR